MCAGKTRTLRSTIYLFKHFTVHIEHWRQTAIANECELIARSGTFHLRPAKTIFSCMTRDISVFVKCDTTFRYFFWKLPQFQTSKFRKLVRQHTECVLGNIIRVLLEIYLDFQQ